MHAGYYQNIVYPLQDKILKIVEALPVNFYLTGGTALGRVWLNHRCSDDLDFFVNAAPDFRNQVNTVINHFSSSNIKFDATAADDSFARIFVYDGEGTLKLDFVNDIPFRKGELIRTDLFPRIDNIINILSNKLAALSRYAVRDVVDIVFISQNISFNWEEMFKDASDKDLWANPVNASGILEEFPVEKLQEITWLDKMPDSDWFASRLNIIIRDMLEGNDNSLVSST